MTEIERLRADLATIQKAAEIAKEAGFHRRTGTYDMVEEDLKQKIAGLEAQADEWWQVRDRIKKFANDYDIKKYVCYLEARISELEGQLAQLKTVEQLSCFSRVHVGQKYTKKVAGDPVSIIELTSNDGIEPLHLAIAIEHYGESNLCDDCELQAYCEEINGKKGKGCEIIDRRQVWRILEKHEIEMITLPFQISNRKADK